MNRYKTPMRYPGGKQRLAPFMAELLQACDFTGGDYVEVYAGGAGIAVELLLSGVAGHVHLNDLSLPVYSFWKSVVEQPEALCRLIRRASLTVAEWSRQKTVLTAGRKASPLELGFSFFYLNRCNRSGIVSGGVIGGRGQSGPWKMDARFPQAELVRRIEVIATKADRITVTNFDAEEFIKQRVGKLPKQTLVYFDPPYFNRAERLYLSHYQPADHVRLAKRIQRSVKRPWVISYDCTPEVLENYPECRSFNYDLQYNAATVYKGKEVLFFSDEVAIPMFSKVPCVDAGLRDFYSARH